MSIIDKLPDKELLDWLEHPTMRLSLSLEYQNGPSDDLDDGPELMVWVLWRADEANGAAHIEIARGGTPRAALRAAILQEIRNEEPQ